VALTGAGTFPVGWQKKNDQMIITKSISKTCDYTCTQIGFAISMVKIIPISSVKSQN